MKFISFLDFKYHYRKLKDIYEALIMFLSNAFPNSAAQPEKTTWRFPTSPWSSGLRLCNYYYR